MRGLCYTEHSERPCKICKCLQRVNRQPQILGRTNRVCIMMYNAGNDLFVFEGFNQTVFINRIFTKQCSPSTLWSQPKSMSLHQQQCHKNSRRQHKHIEQNPEDKCHQMLLHLFNVVSSIKQQQQQQDVIFSC